MEFEQLLQVLETMGLVSTLGISFEGTGEDLYCRMPITERLTGAPNIAHGGSLTALLDTALGVHAARVAYSYGKATSTVELKTNFLRPARLGQTIVTSTSLQFEGKSLLVVTGTATEEESGKKIAYAVGTFNMYEHKQLPKSK